MPRSRWPAQNTQWYFVGFLLLYALFGHLLSIDLLLAYFHLCFYGAFVCVFPGFCSLKRERDWRWVGGEDLGEIGGGKKHDQNIRYTKFFSIKTVEKS